MNYRIKITLAMLVLQLASCGLLFYLIHKNHILEERIQNTIRKLDEADRRVRQDTDRLNQLLKLLPPKPAPDKSSKL